MIQLYHIIQNARCALKRGYICIEISGVWSSLLKLANG